MLEIIEDISEALEPIPVSLEYTDSSQLNELRKVHRKYILHSIVPSLNSTSYYDGCACSTICTNSEKDCGCIFTHGHFYTQTIPRLFIFLSSNQNSKLTPPIYECNAACACGPECPNRLVQHGCAVPLRIFDTGTRRGWGVRTMRPAKKGEFVCEYAGEVVRTKDVRRHRWDGNGNGMNYVLCIRENIGDKILRTNIDATTTGNVARYINHSCQPNLSLFTVRVNSFIPTVALFVNKDISEGQEVTYDYGDGIIDTDSEGQHIDNKIECLCGAGKGICRGWLPFDSQL